MFILLLLFSISTQSQGQSQQITYDDLALKRCNDQDWSIHGLWPEYNQSSWPQYCNSSRNKDFTPKSIDFIMDLMNKYWYSCVPGNEQNWEFWKHEWNKHGTCQSYQPSVYFNNTLNIFIDAYENNWYGCCDSSNNNCLIHINKTTYKWLGKC